MCERLAVPAGWLCLGIDTFERFFAGGGFGLSTSPRDAEKLADGSRGRRVASTQALPVRNPGNVWIEHLIPPRYPRRRCKWPFS
jgi:hypothetical protein